MIALIAQLTVIINISRLNNERRFLIDKIARAFHRTSLPPATTKFVANFPEEGGEINILTSRRVSMNIRVLKRS